MRKSEHQKRLEAAAKKDRERSRRNREKSKNENWPAGAMVDRAIVQAQHNVWYGQVKSIAGSDRELQRRATGVPVNMWRVADEAVRILVHCKRKDMYRSSQMVMARLMPRDALNARKNEVFTLGDWANAD